VIPEAAVEAAARKLCTLASYDWDNIDAPDDVAADFKAQITAQAKQVLEAAAPHMLAAAWDDGHLMGWSEATANTLPERESLWRNPYRSKS
jgi:hypothetical protein